MVTRREFLSISGLGLLAVSAGCQPPGISDSLYADDLPTGAPSLRRLVRIKPLKNRMLGYPINMNRPPEEFFAWRSELLESGVGTFAFNNVGNPFRESPILFNTHEFESELIRRFGELFAFPSHDTWGFLSHSGTDSNMHGMYMGRTILAGRTGVLPKIYFTREAHYSIQILRDLLALETVMVETLPDGGMDPDNLGDQLSENADFPALVVATVGTTFKGAVYRIDLIQKRLVGHESYLHLDAALFGGYLPFTSHADEVAHLVNTDSGAGRYDSLAVSCHKFFGFPSPAGLFITRKGLYDEFNNRFAEIHRPEYIHHVPGTITCSRDAVKPAEFYYFSTQAAFAKQTEDAARMLENSTHLLNELQTHFPQLGAHRSNALSNTVYFRAPNQSIIDKYSLATMQLKEDGGSAKYAHVVVMPHVSRSVLAAFLQDLEQHKH